MMNFAKRLTNVESSTLTNVGIFAEVHCKNFGEMSANV